MVSCVTSAFQRTLNILYNIDSDPIVTMEMKITCAAVQCLPLANVLKTERTVQSLILLGLLVNPENQVWVYLDLVFIIRFSNINYLIN